MMTIKQRLKLTQNTMRKTVILLMTLTLVVTSIGAATAKGQPDKPDKPSSDPVYYNVTMELVEAGEVEAGEAEFLDGLSTGETCAADPFVLRLEESRSGSLLATWDGAFPSDLKPSEPNLYLKAWFDETQFDGCWHGTNPDSDLDSEAPGPDFFRMVFDRDGALVKLTWHFDVEAKMRTSKNGRHSNMHVLHKYALTSQSVTWDKTTGIVTGSFELWNYTNIDGPVWELIGTSELEFTLTIAPS